MSAFRDYLHKSTLPAVGTVWVEKDGTAYLVKHASYRWITCRCTGQTVRVSLADFLNQLSPVEEMLEVVG